jgi:hypothetical protein
MQRLHEPSAFSCHDEPCKPRGKAGRAARFELSLREAPGDRNGTPMVCESELFTVEEGGNKMRFTRLGRQGVASGFRHLGEGFGSLERLGWRQEGFLRPFRA